jgi:hypothetical protein
MIRSEFSAGGLGVKAAGGRGGPRRGAEHFNAMGNLFSGGGGSKKPQPAAAKPVAILEKDQAILVRILQTSPLVIRQP